jgi:hypothetical protein
MLCSLHKAKYGVPKRVSLLDKNVVGKVFVPLFSPNINGQINEFIGRLGIK